MFLFRKWLCAGRPLVPLPEPFWLPLNVYVGFKKAVSKQEEKWEEKLTSCIPGHSMLTPIVIRGAGQFSCFRTIKCQIPRLDKSV